MISIEKEEKIQDFDEMNLNNELSSQVMDIHNFDQNCEIVVSQPKLVNIQLYLHQLKSIQDMEQLEKSGEVVISWPSQFKIKISNYLKTSLGSLSDFPGHGKALSMIGLIAKTLNDSCSDEFLLEKIEKYNYVSNIKVEIIEQTKCSLILVNISLISQWIFELNRTLLRYKAIYTKNEIENVEVNNYDVILVANNVYNSFAMINKRRAWKRFIIDEPSSLKIPNMEITHALFYWLITATPLELYLKRRTGFLNDLLPEDMNIFKYLIVKNEDDFVKNSYKMPPTRHLRYTCAEKNSKIFEGLISENMIEMLDAGNIEDIISIFGISDTKNPIPRANIFETFIEKKMKRLEDLEKEPENYRSKKTQEKIENIKLHLKIFKDRIKTYISENICDNCSIPGEKTVLYDSVYSCCQNINCSNCFVKDSSCLLCKNPENSLLPLNISLDCIGSTNIIQKNPICEVNIEKSDGVQLLQNEVVENSNNISSSNTIVRSSLVKKFSKISKILDIIGDSNGKKILIFSNHNESFTILKRFLDEKSLKYLELRGTKEKRDNTIDQYKTGNINILLLNTFASGAGLNLCETTDIILYHVLPEFQKIQVIGRANRIGRTLDLTVHYME